MKRMLVLLTTVFLVACQTPANFEGNEESPYYIVPAGSHLALKRDLTIPADQLAVYVQGGQVLSRMHVSLYNVYCKFALHDTSALARSVMMDDFAITRVRRNLFWARADYTQLADRDDGYSMGVYTIIMELHSDHQPQVAGLACGKWNMPIDSTYPSISEIRRALGDLFSLKIAPRR
jgi:hypothetical protein